MDVREYLQREGGGGDGDTGVERGRFQVPVAYKCGTLVLLLDGSWRQARKMVPVTRETLNPVMFFS